MNVVVDPICLVCNAISETLRHTICNCQYVSEVWKLTLEEYFTNTCNGAIKYEWLDILKVNGNRSFIFKGCLFREFHQREI